MCEFNKPSNDSDDNRRWDEAFARSQDQLAELAEKVRADIRAGNTLEIDIGEL